MNNSQIISYGRETSYNVGSSRKAWWQPEAAHQQISEGHLGGELHKASADHWWSNSFSQSAFTIKWKLNALAWKLRHFCALISSLSKLFLIYHCKHSMHPSWTSQFTLPHSGPIVYSLPLLLSDNFAWSLLLSPLTIFPFWIMLYYNLPHSSAPVVSYMSLYIPSACDKNICLAFFNRSKVSWELFLTEDSAQVCDHRQTSVNAWVWKRMRSPFLWMQVRSWD